MALAPEKQSANQATIFKAREETIQTISATAAFETREPNSFSDFGGELTMVARRPFSQTRQRRKGSSVDLDVAAGWNEDFTASNMQSVFDGFMFAAIRSKPVAAISAADSGTGVFTVDDSTGFVDGTLVLIKGLADAADNGLKRVTAAADGTHFTIADINSTEAGANATAEVVGFEFDADDVSMALSTGGFRLISAAFDMTTFGLIPGEWVAIGGDEATSRMGGLQTLSGFARIAVDGLTSAGDDTITFDKSTFTPANNDGGGDTLRIFFGNVIRNEDDPDNIVKLTDTIERPLGRDADGRMSEVMFGATPNEITWNSPLANLVNVDVAYVCMTKARRPGSEGLLAGSGTTTLSPAPGEDGWNTSRNLYRARMSIVDPTTLNPTPLFGKVTEWSMTITNNVSPDKAQGVYGAFDTTEGMFEVDAEFTTYFRDHAAGDAIDNDADVTFDAIYSKRNVAFIMDLPLVGTGGGRPEVEQDQAIMLPITNAAAESPFGHTLLVNWLPYIPSYLNATG